MHSLAYLVAAALPLITLVPGIHAAGDTDRYMTGPYSDVSASMDWDESGFLSVGADGVLRSFAGDGTVIDYRQLDPEQVSSFAESQLTAWKNTGMEVPESVTGLLAAAAAATDGRLVTDEAELLYPAKVPGTGTSPVETREVVEKLQGLEAHQSCVGMLCQSLPECQPQCNACYYPGGPPFGVCFL